MGPGPCQNQGSPVRGSLTPSAYLHHPHDRLPPLASLDRRPIPLPVLSGCPCVLLSPVLCKSASPSLFSARSLGVFWSLISFFGRTFALGREAWAPPIPGNSLTKTLSSRYLAMPLSFSLTPPPVPVPQTLVLAIPSTHCWRQWGVAL